MKKLDVLGYYLTRFSQIEVELIEAIMGSRIPSEKQSFDKTIENEKVMLKTLLKSIDGIKSEDITSLLD